MFLFKKKTSEKKLLICVNPPATAIEYGLTIGPNSVTESVTEVEVAAKTTKVSNDLTRVERTLYIS